MIQLHMGFSRTDSRLYLAKKDKVQQTWVGSPAAARPHRRGLHLMSARKRKQQVSATGTRVVVVSFQHEVVRVLGWPAQRHQLVANADLRVLASHLGMFTGVTRQGQSWLRETF
jgi:hypothetical protein